LPHHAPIGSDDMAGMGFDESINGGSGELVWVGD
jgi:hypothetical protein